MLPPGWQLSIARLTSAGWYDGGMSQPWQSAAEKVVTLDALLAALAPRRAAGERVAFTNGTFDLIHVGHLRSLEQARAHGDLLVVGVNSDASVRSYKEPGRPIVRQAER